MLSIARRTAPPPIQSRIFTLVSSMQLRAIISYLDSSCVRARGRQRRAGGRKGEKVHCNNDEHTQARADIPAPAHTSSRHADDRHRMLMLAMLAMRCDDALTALHARLNGLETLTASCADVGRTSVLVRHEEKEKIPLGTRRFRRYKRHHITHTLTPRLTSTLQPFGNLFRGGDTHATHTRHTRDTHATHTRHTHTHTHSLSLSLSERTH
ncbi:hypothetical protein IE81DRAFT_255495 [Ceraceosorus guamensis]|uniref:Uncharacterized protein n=1 Tax=Ceraceosorus guamensis TaxID=1522189 RepID=A0A316VRA4_9BASI|nr:hypothetical protein IE81DRAFT_255495 [Ceraceosorus guamensis]PWN39880.1 hypothetical protein IE81DRAFT_255495 [Ceraceosorus guamensis]